MVLAARNLSYIGIRYTGPCVENSWHRIQRRLRDDQVAAMALQVLTILILKVTQVATERAVTKSRAHLQLALLPVQVDVLQTALCC